MKKQLPLYILLIFLIAVNGFFLVKYFGDSKESDDFKEPRGPGNFISNRLSFSDDQKYTFNALEKSHRERMMLISNEIRASKEALFDQISNPNADAMLVDSITSVIGEFEKKKDLEVFQHFKAIYDICDDSQKERFNDLLKDALHKGPPPRGKRPPRGMGNDRPGPPPPRH